MKMTLIDIQNSSQISTANRKVFTGTFQEPGLFSPTLKARVFLSKNTQSKRRKRVPVGNNSFGL